MKHFKCVKINRISSDFLFKNANYADTMKNCIYNNLKKLDQEIEELTHVFKTRGNVTTCPDR